MTKGSAEEYVFRYPLSPLEKEEPVYHDRLVEMIREQLENLLNLVIPVRGKEEVKVDGFKLLRDLNTIYRIFPGHED